MLENTKAYLFAVMELANSFGWKQLMVLLGICYLITEINVYLPRLLIWPVVMLIVLKSLVVGMAYLRELFNFDV